ncbi:MAG: major facilitator superfamily protein [Promethearchaeota archaeon CR_4]|nr:MAG: major facilitator superfamily protein [Candidatus Lokiarchaeota archaeon CR_4]
MIRTRTFPLLWIMYVCSAICGLMVIGNFMKYGQAIDPSLVGETIVGIAAIAGFCNAGGRIVWGKLSDKLGGVKTMRIMFLVQCMAMILFAIAGLSDLDVVAGIAIWAIFGNLVYFCFGGNLSLFPATTRKYFGPKNMGLNYSIVFTAYGVAGILGAILAGPLLTLMGNAYTGYFILFGCTSLLAFFVSFKTNAPARKSD